VVDEALRWRYSGSVSQRAAWGDVVDAYLASNPTDQARIQRCLEESVAVHWSGTSELFKDATGKSLESGMLFVFEPAVGPRSLIDYDASIEFAALDGVPVPIGEKQSDVFYAHVRNTAALDTFISLDLAGPIAGKSLAVRWRIRIVDLSTTQPIASDWVHTETIPIPSDGNGFIFGRRNRAESPDLPDQ
jgi:hypothetical protein